MARKHGEGLKVRHESTLHIRKDYLWKKRDLHFNNVMGGPL